MVSTLNLQADACHVIHPVSKVFFFYYYAATKKIFLISVPTGMITIVAIHKSTPRVPIVAFILFCVVAVGTAMIGIVVLPIEAIITLNLAAMDMVFVLH